MPAFPSQYTRSILLLLAVLALFPQKGRTQTKAAHSAHLDWNFQQFTTHQGLGSNEVYDILMDAVGQLWICTDNGISLFDGLKFKHFRSTEWSPVVLCTDLGPKETPWFLTLKNELLYYDRGKDQIIKVHWYQPGKLTTKGVPTSFQVTDTVLSFGHQMASVIIKNWQVDELRSIREFPNVKLQFAATQGTSYYSFEEKDSFHIAVGNNSHTKVLFSAPHSIGNPSISIDDNERWHCEQYGNYLISIRKSDNNVSFIELPYHLVASVSIVSDTEVWVGTQGHGALCFSLDSLQLIKNVLIDRKVSAIKRGDGGNIWFGTATRGLFLAKTTACFKLQSDADVNVIRLIDNQLIIGMNDGKIYSITKDNQEYKLVLLAALQQQILDLHSVDEGFLAVLPSSIQRFNIRTQENTIYTITDSILAPRKPIFSNGPFILRWNFTSRQYDTIDKNWETTRIRNSFTSSSGNTYLGNFYKTKYLEGQSNKCKEMVPSGAFDLRAVETWSDDTVLLGTKGSGLLLAVNENILYPLEHETYGTNNISDITGKRNNIWFSTQNNLYKLMGIKDSALKCQPWASIIGIENERIRSILSWNSDLVVLASSGLYSLSPLQVDTAQGRPTIHALHLRTLDTFYRFYHENVVLNYKRSGIAIEPMATSFNNALAVRFRYKAPSINKAWIDVSASPIEIPSLPPGNHEIIVQAQGAFGIWSQPKSLHIEVEPPFWQTSPFIAVVFIMTLVLGLTITSWRIKRLKTKTTLELELAEAKNKSMSLQLNPHFVFNSLNSVMAYIAENKSQFALRFLARFAKMMRLIFENSQHKLITLNQELSAVERYLQLELFRLNDRFKYQINIEPNLDTNNLLIPPLILQPVVENSIWHGMAKMNPSDTHGLIDIKVSLSDSQTLKIAVTNNGPHGEESAGKTEKRTTSLEVIKQRLALLSRLHKQRYAIEQGLLPNIGHYTSFELPILKPLSSSNESNHS